MGPVSPSPSHDRKTIASNFVGVTAMNGLGLIAGLFISVYVRRVLGPVAFGQVAWAAAVLAYLALIVTPGLQVIGQRDVARDPGHAERLASLILTVQAVLFTVAYALIVILAAFDVRGSQVNAILMIQGLALLFTALDIGWLLQARERMVAPAVVTLFFTLLQVPFLVMLVRGPEDVLTFVALNLPFAAANLAYKFWYLKRHRLLDLSRIRPTLRGARAILAESWPLAFSAGAIVVLYNCDTIILGFTHGDETVGQYASAYKLMLVGTVVSAALSNAYFPSLCRVHADRDQAAKVGSEFIALMAWAGIPIAILGWVCGQAVVDLLYGAQFAESGIYFRWLCLNLALIFVNVSISAPLTAWGHQKTHFMITGISGLLNLVLNLALLPTYGPVAAIATTVAAEVVALIALIIVRRRIGLGWRPLLPILLPPVACGAAVAALLVALPAPYNGWILQCTLGVVLFAGALFVFERRIILAGFKLIRRA